MLKSILATLAVLLALLFILQGPSTPSDDVPVEEVASSRIQKISPSMLRKKEAPKPYLMLHLEDIKTCFPNLIANTRPEDLVTLDAIMVEVEKTFLPSEQQDTFQQVRFRDLRDEVMVIRLISESGKGYELFRINDKKEWIEEPLDPAMKSWPPKTLFAHFVREYDVIEEEKHFRKRGRRGESVLYQQKGDDITSIIIQSPVENRELSCSLREPKAILCLCDIQGA